MSEPNMSNERVFFVIWNETGRSPTHKHLTLATARTEAKRLASENPGQRFNILEALEYVEKVEPITHLAFDNIPF